jgi:dihydrofolate synthase/folylpolyglutamate synthase
MNYSESVEYLLALPDMERFSTGSSARSMTLAAMLSLLGVLGNPEMNRKTVHVTGSKGKGSTSAMLASLLSRVAPTSLYSSPHLHSYCERICFDLMPCSEELFAAGVSEIAPAVTAVHQGEEGPISTFGAMTALFFHLGKLRQMVWQVVEVGMGGTFDATNVFAQKELVVITPISLEHTKILGNTTLEIGAHVLNRGLALLMWAPLMRLFQVRLTNTGRTSYCKASPADASCA